MAVFELDASAVLVNTGNWWKASTGAIEDAMTKALDPYPPSDSPYVYGPYDGNLSLTMAIDSLNYMPFTACTVYFQYRKHDIDFFGAAIDTATEPGYDRTLQFELYIDDVLFFTSSTYTVDYTTATVAVTVPLSALVGLSWGAFKVVFVSGGTTGNKDAELRSPIISWFKITFEADISTKLTAIPEDVILTSVDEVWTDSDFFWGHNEVAYLPYPLGSIYTGFAKWGYKESGVMTQHETHCHVLNRFLPIAKDWMTITYLSPVGTAGDVYTITIYGTSYTVVLGVTPGFSLVRYILEYWEELFRLHGFTYFVKSINGSYFILPVEEEAFVELSGDETGTRYVLPRQHVWQNLTPISAWATPRSFTTA